MKNKLYYAVSNLDDRVHGPDHLITQDVNKLCHALAEIYSNVAKPVLDCVLYNYQLSKSVGVEGMVALVAVVQLSAGLLKMLTPRFGRAAAEEAALDATYQTDHSKLVEFSEEIAFLRGQEIEKNVVERAYYALIKRLDRTSHMRFFHGIANEAIIKWLWGAVGLAVCSLPVFVNLPRSTVTNTQGSRTESLVTNRRLLVSGSDAMGRLISTYSDLAELSGYVNRVTVLLDTLDSLEKGESKKTTVSNNPESLAILSQRGTIEITDGEIEFDAVPVVTPTGQILIKSLTFVIKPGEHLLVVGGNGTGKSSLFRILGGLWPVHGGKVRKPKANEFMYIPQRPYMTSGTLRDQVIYPHTAAEMYDSGRTDEELLTILEMIDVSSILSSAGGWDAVKDWATFLSVGNQQQLAMARLFYHKPKYAILDECTSSVTADIEKQFYEQVIACGVTLMTVSHRTALWKYHTHILQYYGEGKYTFCRFDPEERLNLYERKTELEASLANVDPWRARLSELKLEQARRELRKEA